MTQLAFIDATILAGPTDLSGQSNEISLEAQADAQESTTFRSGGWRERQGGLKSGSFDVKGFFDAGTLALPDDSLFANLGARMPLTVSPNAPVDGGLAYLLPVMRGKYQWGGQIGELLPFEAGGESDGLIARGAYGETGVNVASGNGAAVNLGAVAPNQKLVAALHVVSVAGTAAPTLTARIESDDSGAFATPVTRGTFQAATGLTSEWLEIPSPGVGETFWRVSWVITGTTPSFTFYASFGIAAA